MWLEFILALVIFLLSHAIPMRPALRQNLINRLGRRGYFTIYAMGSTLLLIWLFRAAGHAPYVGLWVPYYSAPFWGMPVVCWLVVEGVLTPNPLSLGRSGSTRNSIAPHALGPLTRHPLLLAMALWTGLHIMANPDVAHVILFGLLGGFSVLSMFIMDRVRPKRMGAEWDRLAKGSARFNPLAILHIRPNPIAVILALLIYGAALVAHPYFAGVPILHYYLH